MAQEMAHSVDFYLGGFLIVSGFVLSLLNLKRIVKGSKVSFPTVLLSQNLLISCIGIAFVSRSIYELSPLNTEMSDIEERSTEIMKMDTIKCGFMSILISYGPLIVSLVNSFLSLIIDNYMHYRMIANVKKDEEESTVQEINSGFGENSRMSIKKLFSFIKKYFTFITVVLQWVVPISIALSMYSIDVKEMMLMDHHRGLDNSCMALLDAEKANCSLSEVTNDTELRKYITNKDYLELYEIDLYNNSDKRVDTIVSNIYEILANYKNETIHSDITVTTGTIFRKPKQNLDQKCMKICFLENRKLLLYMFGVSVISYFIPITISTIILTKIHIMDVRNKNVKTYVNRELLYNILFWTPVMFDTFLTITLCSYTMNGMRTSIFNVIANVYQAVKNFMNTKYFKDNAVVPV